jgi:hypothetical protein
VFGIAPVEAANKALARAGIGWDEVEVVELNEAFASQSLACLAGWPELDPEKVNVRGRRDRDRASARRVRRRGSSGGSPTSCTRAAAATAWRQSASAWARASP